jgi:hypothetical protein
MTMIAGETRELFPKPPAPEAFVGLASPLWGLFAGAAMSGVAWWWMTRWALAEPELPPTPVGGEAAPIAPVVEVLDAANEVAAAPTPKVSAPPEAGAPEPRRVPPEPRSVVPKAKPQARQPEPPSV